MKKLIENSIHLPGGIMIACREDKERSIDMHMMRFTQNGMYNQDETNICFVHETEIYVTPNIYAVIQTLKEHGFKKSRDLSVPLLRGEYPKGNKYQWEFLKNKADAQRAAYYTDACKSYSFTHSIGEIDKSILKKSLRITRDGIPFRYPDKNTKEFWFPIANDKIFNNNVAAVLGHYNTENDIVVFIADNGHTYVTKSTKAIISALEYAHYQKDELLPVPLANNEEIDGAEDINNIWQNILSQK